MTLLKIALLQMASCGADQAANLAKGEAFCRQAAEQGADIALFPEMWNIGYQLPAVGDEPALSAWREGAISHEDDFFRHFAALAQELKMAIALTYLEQWPGRPRNTVTLIDRHGQDVLTYAKVHTCEFDAECALTPGDGFPVCDLDTAAGAVKIGAMICFDREFPESARILMLNGAEIILTPNACTLEQLRIGQFQARAFENMVGLAMSNYAAPQNNGHSIAFDGMAFGEDETSRDMKLVEAGEAEGVYMATFDLDALRAYRAYEAMGNTFRRPRLYGALTETAVHPPFIRASATR
jgi:predicted amidohydrolase